MKKLIGIFLIVILLSTLCLPVFAKTTGVEDILENAEKNNNGFVRLFQSRCLHMPVTIKPVIFTDLYLNIDGKIVDFNSAAQIEQTEGNSEDQILIVPTEEEYTEPIMDALRNNFPYLLIETEESEETGLTQILVSLPEMTNDLHGTFLKLLNAYWVEGKEKIDLVKSTTEPRLIIAGGSDADKATLEAMCDDALKELNAVKDEYEEYIEARYKLYLSGHPENGIKIGSVLSEGNPILIVGIASFSIGFLAAMFIFKKEIRSNNRMKNTNVQKEFSSD